METITRDAIIRKLEAQPKKKVNAAVGIKIERFHDLIEFKIKIYALRRFKTSIRNEESDHTHSKFKSKSAL